MARPLLVEQVWHERNGVKFMVLLAAVLPAVQNHRDQKIHHFFRSWSKLVG